MKNRLKCAIALWASLLLLAACGGDDSFRILGDVDELGTQNLRFVYLQNGQMQAVNSIAVDGQFSFEGRSDQPTLVEIYTSSSTLIGRVIVRNGETVKCRLALADPWKMSAEGNGDSERLAKFLTDNAAILASADRAAVNSKIAEFVGKNKDRLVSAVLLSRYYFTEGYQAQADSLMGLINPKARPTAMAADFYDRTSRSAEVADSVRLEPIRVVGRRDSLLTLRLADRPLTLLTFTRATERVADSVARASAAAISQGIRVVDVSLDPDTTAWHRSLRIIPDSVRSVRRVWAIGGEASPWLAQFNLYRSPMFVLADSAGRVLYRGHSTDRLSDALRSASTTTSSSNSR